MLARRPPAPNPHVVAVLVDHRRRFLAFLERRVRRRSDAEDLLQAAFVKGIRRSGSLRRAERAAAWFYRLLRNALADYYRRTAVESRLFPDPDGATTGPSYEPGLRGAVCACIGRVLPALKPGYAEILRRAELEDEPLDRIAQDLGITANNAGVRLHRARRALRRQLQRSCGACADHGCLDCGCRAVAPDVA